MTDHLKLTEYAEGHQAECERWAAVLGSDKGKKPEPTTQEIFYDQVDLLVAAVRCGLLCIIFIALLACLAGYFWS